MVGPREYLISEAQFDKRCAILSRDLMTSADLLPELALIPAGDFVMGSDDAEDDERPPHRVYLDEFLIGVYPVTNTEYARFVRETGHRAPAIYELPIVVTAGSRDREHTFRSAGQPYVWVESLPPRDRLDHPVTLVRWDDAAAYCAWLSGSTGRAVRLPTEAEWEKAARGGLESKRYPWGERLDRNLANFLTDPAQRPARGTTPCGAYPPNGYGLFDVSGNVWEWVHDWYDPTYYVASPDRNPTGPRQGHLRIVRGGGWLVVDVRMLSCSYRHKVPPDTYSYGIGFRIACAPA
jgi:formylglycine-generating enzyme